MNKNQWYTFGIGFIILSMFLFTTIGRACLYTDGDALVACVVRRYAYSIPAIISFFLGMIFNICGGLEKK